MTSPFYRQSVPDLDLSIERATDLVPEDVTIRRVGALSSLSGFSPQ